MKKRIFSLLLTLSMIFMFLPHQALAQETSEFEGINAIRVSENITQNTAQDAQILYLQESDSNLLHESPISTIYRASGDTTFTITNVTEDSATYLLVYFFKFTRQDISHRVISADNSSELNTAYYSDGTAYTLYDDSRMEHTDGTENTLPTLDNRFWYPGLDSVFSFDGKTIIRSGESVTIKLPVDSEDSLYRLCIHACDPQTLSETSVFFDMLFEGRSSIFLDVNNSDYFFNPVLWATESAISNGTGHNYFSPDQVCTNAQILTFMWRSAGSPDVDLSNPFSNLTGDEYYYPAVLWATEQGMIDGDFFDSDQICTRATTVEYLWKQAGSPKGNKAPIFSDISSDASYADAVLWALENNITSGTSENQFSPDLPCSRGQIITFLYRSLRNSISEQES